jgi:hypothetical protein
LFGDARVLDLLDLGIDLVALVHEGAEAEVLENAALSA